jgi:hypothetical protein
MSQVSETSIVRGFGECGASGELGNRSRKSRPTAVPADGDTDLDLETVREAAR